MQITADERKTGNTGILIEGGAMRSVFAAGVLDFLMDRNIEIPNVLAVSAGAYAGMNYISGQKGRTVEAVVKPLKEKKYMGLMTFFKKGTFFDMDYLFDTVPRKLSPFDFVSFREAKKTLPHQYNGLQNGRERLS